MSQNHRTRALLVQLTIAASACSNVGSARPSAVQPEATPKFAGAACSVENRSVAAAPTRPPGGRESCPEGSVFVAFTLVESAINPAGPDPSSGLFECLSPKPYVPYRLRNWKGSVVREGRSNVVGLVTEDCLPDEGYEIDFGRGWEVLPWFEVDRVVAGKINAAGRIFPDYSLLPWCVAP